MKRSVLAGLIFWPLLVAAQGAKPISLQVRGDVAKALSLDAEAWSKLPRTSVMAENGHDHTKASYEGVSLRDLLTAAGLPEGEQVRGKAMAIYLRVRASDGYLVVIAFAETDPSFTGQKILLADSMNGKPLDAKEGPLRLIVPDDKRPARWVRMVQAIEVAQAN